MKYNRRKAEVYSPNSLIAKEILAAAKSLGIKCKVVTITTVRKQLSRFLNLANRGWVIVITVHGLPKAQMQKFERRALM
jgi:hypothetical protein